MSTPPVRPRRMLIGGIGLGGALLLLTTAFAPSAGAAEADLDVGVDLTVDLFGDDDAVTATDPIADVDADVSAILGGIPASTVDAVADVTVGRTGPGTGLVEADAGAAAAAAGLPVGGETGAEWLDATATACVRLLGGSCAQAAGTEGGGASTGGSGSAGADGSGSASSGAAGFGAAGSGASAGGLSEGFGSLAGGLLAFTGSNMLMLVAASLAAVAAGFALTRRHGLLFQ